jgi:hypothetical protein
MNLPIPPELQAVLDEARRHVVQRDLAGAAGALNRLIEARAAFADQLLNDYAAEYQTAVGALLPTLRKGFVLQATLGIPLPGLHHAKITDLREPAKVLFYLPDLRMAVRSGEWERGLGSGGVDDPEALALYRELIPIHETIQGLEQLMGKRSKPTAPGEEFNSGAYSHWAITGGCAVTRL